jgi:hypothetical protein
MNNARIGMVFVGLLLPVSGCGTAGRHETAKVTGMVTLDGKAFTEGGTVMFEPAQQGKMATGVVRPDGSFEMTTYKMGDGAIVGKHRVAITPATKFVSDKAPETEPDQKSSIPYQCRAASSSGIEFEVKSGEVNNCHLELISKMK